MRPCTVLFAALAMCLPALADDRAAPLTPVEVLNLNQSLWGQDVPNVLKGIPVAYDPKRDRIYTAGITSSHIAVTDPAKGRPIAAVDIEVSGFRVCELLYDAARDRLFYVSHNDGTARRVDPEKLVLAARYDPERTDDRGGDRYPVKAAAVEPASGNLLLAHPAAGGLVELNGDTLALVRVHSEAHAPFDLAWDEVGKRMLVLDIASKREGMLLAYAPDPRRWSVVRPFGPDFSPRPPRRIAAGGGTIFVQADGIMALSADGKEVLWTAEVDQGAHQMLGLPGRLVVVCREGESGPEANGAFSSLCVYDAKSGRRTGRVVVGFEASWAAVDPAGRVFVGNGGDGSVSVIDLAAAKETARCDVANSVESIAVDARTGRRFLLNRLGGSVVYVWEKDAQVLSELKAGGWPVELTLDERGRRLYVLNHYEAALRVFDVDSLQELDPIPCGVPGSRTDSLSDLAIDAEAGVAACAFPEIERVAVVDLKAGKAIRYWTPSGFEGGPSRGPGELQVAVDGRRVIAWAPHGRGVWAFDVDSGKETVARTMPGKLRRGSYALDLMWVWRDGGKVFAGGTALDLKTLAPAGEIAGVDKIVGAAAGRLWGMTAARDGQEMLVALETKSLRPEATWALVRTAQIRTQAAIDPASRRIYVADMARARVSVFELP